MFLTYLISLQLLLAAVLLLRACFRKTVSPHVIYALWLAVLLRMVIPVPLFSAALPVPEIFRTQTTRPAEEHPASVDPIQVGAQTPGGIVVSESVSPGMTPNDIFGETTPPMWGIVSVDTAGAVKEPGETNALPADNAVSRPSDVPPHTVPPHTEGNEPVNPTASAAGERDTVTLQPRHARPITILNLVWAVGALVTAAVFSTSGILFFRRVKRDRVYRCTVQKTKVYVSANAGGSCLLGLCPAVYLTPQAAESADASLVILHEYTHLRHGDMIWSLIRTLALIVFWWDPFVWLAVRCARQDAELSCDAAVTRQLTRARQIDYARVIVDTVPVRRSAAVGFGSGELRERILMITHRPAGNLAAAVLAVLLCLLAAGCTFIGASTPTDTVPEPADPVVIDMLDPSTLPEGCAVYEGMYFRGAGGQRGMIFPSGEICILAPIADNIVPENLQTGDSIRAVLGAHMETYPMQATLYALEIIADGMEIDPEILMQLTEFGIAPAETAAPASQKEDVLRILRDCRISLGGQSMASLTGYVSDTETPWIALYTANQGTYVTEIPYEIFDGWPATDPESVDWKHGWLPEQLRFYYASYGDVRWAGVSLQTPVMGAGRKNIARSLDGGNTWSCGSHLADYGGALVSGMGFASADTAFMSFDPRYENGDSMKGSLISRTTDGGAHWERLSFDIPSVWEGFTLVAGSPVFWEDSGIYPIDAYLDGAYYARLYLTTEDGGLHWAWPSEGGLVSYPYTDYRFPDTHDWEAAEAGILFCVDDVDETVCHFRLYAWDAWQRMEGENAFQPDAPFVWEIIGYPRAAWQTKTGFSDAEVLHTVYSDTDASCFCIGYDDDCYYLLCIRDSSEQEEASAYLAQHSGAAVAGFLRGNGITANSDCPDSRYYRYTEDFSRTAS